MLQVFHVRCSSEATRRSLNFVCAAITHSSLLFPGFDRTSRASRSNDCSLPFASMPSGCPFRLVPSGRMPTLVYGRILLSTAGVIVYCRIFTQYLAQYYDRISSCRLRRDTSFSEYKRSSFLKHHCTRSPCSSSGNKSYRIQNGWLLSQY